VTGSMIFSTRRMRKPTFAMLALAGLIAACAETDIILPGERNDIRGEPLNIQAVENEVRPISLAAATANAEWTHRNGGPLHAIAHPALGTALTPLFTNNIGAADTVLLVTTGFGEVVALDPASGGEIWRQDLDAPGTSAPTIAGGLAYVVARDGRGWAIDIASGRIRWTQTSTPSVSNFAGGAGAAVNDEFAIFPFPTGEVLASFPEGGLRRWSTVVAGQRPGAAASSISDIAGDPVIDGDRVYVGNVSGRVVALALANGDRLWTATEGAVGPVWPAGGSVFMPIMVRSLRGDA